MREHVKGIQVRLKRRTQNHQAKELLSDEINEQNTQMHGATQRYWLKLITSIGPRQKYPCLDRISNELFVSYDIASAWVIKSIGR
jgi:hypothetical protein